MQTQSCVVQKLTTGIRADTTGLIPDVQILYRPRGAHAQITKIHVVGSMERGATWSFLSRYWHSYLVSHLGQFEKLMTDEAVDDARRIIKGGFPSIRLPKRGPRHQN
jgi:hypothetical protein